MHALFFQRQSPSRPHARSRAVITALLLAMFALNLFGGLHGSLANETEGTDTSTEQGTETETPEINQGQDEPQDPPTPDADEPSPEPSSLDVITNQIDAPAAIYIRKHDCPIDIALPYNATFPELAAACSGSLSNVEFILIQDGSIMETVRTTNGFITFSEVVPGPTTIAEQLPAGFGEPVVFCHSTPPDQSDPSANYQKQPVLAGNQIIHTLVPDEIFECEWFNIPDDGYGSIVIEKYSCALGYDPAAMGADPAVDCPDVTDGVTFILQDTNDPNATPIQTDTGDAVPGAVMFGGLMTSEYTVTEIAPFDLAAVVIVCDGWVVEPTGAYEDNGTIVLPVTMTASEDIVCRWYNIPAAETGQVVIWKYACPAGYPAYTATLEQLRADCAEWVNGVTFKVYAEDGSEWSMMTFPDVATGQGAIAEFPAVPAGPARVEEQIPAGYKNPVAYCYDPATESWLEKQIDYGVFYILVAPEYPVVCEVYNLPVDPSPSPTAAPSGSPAPSARPGTPGGTTGGTVVTTANQTPVKAPVKLPNTGAGATLTTAESPSLSSIALGGLALAVMAAGAMVRRRDADLIRVER